MNKKTMQVVIVVVCLLIAAVVLAYSMGMFSGSTAPPPARQGEEGPRMAPTSMPEE